MDPRYGYRFNQSANSEDGPQQERYQMDDPLTIYKRLEGNGRSVAENAAQAFMEAGYGVDEIAPAMRQMGINDENLIGQTVNAHWGLQQQNDEMKKANAGGFLGGSFLQNAMQVAPIFAGAYGLTNMAASAPAYGANAAGADAALGATEAGALTNAAAAAPAASTAADAASGNWWDNLASEFGGTAQTGSEVAGANAATAGSANASRLIQMGVPAAAAAAAAKAMDASGLDLSKFSSDDIMKTVRDLASGTSLTDIIKSLGTGAVQTAPYLTLDPGNSKPGDYMTNAGWRPLDQRATAGEAFDAAGYRSGGIGAMPQAQNQEYNRFLQSLESGAINDNPFFKSFNQQGQQATERAMQARGMNQSTNLLYSLNNNANANFASFVPQFGNTLLGGAQQETSNWNTQNNANLQAGQLANQFYNSANAANNNAAVTGMNQFQNDLSLKDRYSGIAGKTAQSVAMQPYTYPQFTNINSTGKS